MTRTRNIITAEIEALENQYEQLKQKFEDDKKLLNEKYHELLIENCLLCDEKQYYKEEIITKTISKRPKKTVEVLVGRIYWKEKFTDEDTGEQVEIERCECVRENGEWII